MIYTRARLSEIYMNFDSNVEFKPYSKPPKVQYVHVCLHTYFSGERNKVKVKLWSKLSNQKTILSVLK